MNLRAKISNYCLFQKIEGWALIRGLGASRGALTRAWHGAKAKSKVNCSSSILDFFRNLMNKFNTLETPIHSFCPHRAKAM